MDEERVPAGTIVDGLDITISADHGLPVAGVVILRCMYPSGDVGMVVGTSESQSWVDNIGLVKATEIIIQNDMLIHAITSMRDDPGD